MKDVIRAQLKEFFDGKEYGDDWHFPLNQANIQMSNDPHSSTIDRLENFSVEERNRLKSVLAIWGFMRSKALDKMALDTKIDSQVTLADNRLKEKQEAEEQSKI